MHCQLYLISSFMWIDVDDPLCYYMYHKVHSRNTIFILCVRSCVLHTHVQPVVVCVYISIHCVHVKCLLVLLLRVFSDCSDGMLHVFLCSPLALTVHGVAAAQPAPVHLWLWLRGPSVSRHHAQRGSTHHADHQIHRILQEHLHPPREQRLCDCGLLWRRTGVCMRVVYHNSYHSIGFLFLLLSFIFSRHCSSTVNCFVTVMQLHLHLKSHCWQVG